MPIPASTGAFAIVPCNDLAGALPFWERLGFERTGGDAQYYILTGWSCEVHLTQAGEGPWRVPAENNPFGVFIRTPDVDAIAARVDYGMTGRSIEEPFSAQELDDWMFAECSDAQHASGTCRMGAAGDPRSVVDPDCRVIGCSGLRVIDASVMPTVVRANTHLTTVMIAEKMADHLKQSVKSHVIRNP